MSNMCNQIGDRLVDFADGELPPTEAEAVAAHVATCAACRDRVSRLRRSLAAARDVWERQAATNEGTICRRPRPAWPAVVARWLLPAAAALLIAFGAWRVTRRGAPPTVQPGPPPPAVQATPQEFDREIEQSVLAAQLVAAADALADVPGGQPYACERYAYVAEQYDGTGSADAAQRRLDEVCNRRIEQ